MFDWRGRDKNTVTTPHSHSLKSPPATSFTTSLNCQSNLETMPVCRQNAVHIMAGTLIMLSLGLGYFVNHGFFIVTGFVGANLFQYGFTDFCPAVLIFGLLGLPDAECKTGYQKAAVSTDPKSAELVPSANGAV